MMDIKMIVTDLDGTILNEKKEITEVTRKTLNEFREKGVYITFASGRPVGAINCHSFEPDFIVANNGACVVEKGVMIAELTIASEVLENIMSDLLNENSVLSIAIESDLLTFTNYDKHHQWGKGWNVTFTNFETIPDIGCQKIVALCDDKEIMNKIMSKYEDLSILSFFGESWHCISPKEANKFNGISLICDKLNIDVKDVVAFGDDCNDLEMIKYCGVGVAMGNAVEAIKAVADFVTKVNDDDGVAEFLNNM